MLLSPILILKHTVLWIALFKLATLAIFSYSSAQASQGFLLLFALSQPLHKVPDSPIFFIKTHILRILFNSITVRQGFHKSNYCIFFSISQSKIAKINFINVFSNFRYP